MTLKIILIVLSEFIVMDHNAEGPSHYDSNSPTPFFLITEFGFSKSMGKENPVFTPILHQTLCHYPRVKSEAGVEMTRIPCVGIEGA